MVKIAFWDNSLTERGTSTAVFDYAYYNQKLLGNESYIFYDMNRQDNNENVIHKFKQHFPVFGLNGFHEINNHLKKLGILFLYQISYGTNQGFIVENVVNLIHAIFECEPHGDVYATVSPFIKNYDSSIPILPHMIHLPEHSENMRKELNIPDDSIVFGRYGGKGEFDIPFVHNVVYEFAKNNPSVYFLFAHTDSFCLPLPNIIHLPTIIDLNKKVSFINTCDAMIHARYRGETFGLSIAEFSTKNKPILCCSINEGETAHLTILGDKAIQYNDHNLYSILSNITKESIIHRDWNAYRDYTPEKVMQIFHNIFLLGRV